MNDFIKIFKALTDKNRVRILKMLEKKPSCVCEITSVLNISTSTVSSHLALLKEAGFVKDTRNGKWVDYHYVRDTDSPVLAQLLKMLPEWLNDDDIVMDDAVKIDSADRQIIRLG
ncbi:MAG: ArsR/SmtB family transcription factor [Bacteroidota bacterium]